MNLQFDPGTSSVGNPNSFQHRNSENSREQDERLRKQHYGSAPPPGFSNKARGGGDNSRRGFEHGTDKSNRVISSNVEDGRLRRLSFESGKMRGANAVGLTGQLDHPGPTSGSNLHSISDLDVEQSISDLHREDQERHRGQEKMRRETGAGYAQGGSGDDIHDFGEELVDSLLPEDETDYKNDKHEMNDKKQHRNYRDKESRSDNRGKRLLSQRMRNLKWQNQFRGDIGIFNAPFLTIYESLTPTEEGKAKQKQLLTLLEKLVHKEWPDAQLYLYGSCTNSFGVSKIYIDVCLAINDAEMNKSKVLLKLADILQTDNLQNVQSFTGFDTGKRPHSLWIQSLGILVTYA